MGFIQDLIKKHNDKVLERNQKCDELITRIDASLKKFNELQQQEEYIDPLHEDKWKYQNRNLLVDVKDTFLKLNKADHFDIYEKKKNELLHIESHIQDIFRAHNEHIIQDNVEKAYELIGDVEGRKLDKQQMACIVKEAHSHLVVAGAGSGKTTTVVGKVKYLLQSKKCKPENILVLSFTNASASEMKERIQKETGSDIQASTFHKLGLDIISKVHHKVPRITKINMTQFVKDELLLLIKKDSYYLSQLIIYFIFNKVAAKSEFEFESKKEYDEYLKLNPPITLRQESVKSYGEMDIANFLYKNNIQYEYEKAYEIDTNDEEYGQYYPDFYLPEYGIYIEYFGINKRGQVPSYFKGRHGMSATEVYKQSMDWKRKIHRTNHTKLIECFSYEKFDDILLDNLKSHLQNNGVKCQSKSDEELWEELINKDSNVINGFISLVQTIINLIKSHHYTIEDVKSLIEKHHHATKNKQFLYLIEPLYKAYNDQLQKRNEIDFNDMIYDAIELVKTQQYKHCFQYVIVDEYQDISKSRFDLLKALRDSYNYHLFCVGDDWQSIYRFAGSDIGFILNFEKYWGHSEISKIETTYRFSQQLINISSQFITTNPSQIKKNIKGFGEDIENPVFEIYGYTESKAVEFMNNQLMHLPYESTVFLLGRYSFDINLINNDNHYTCQYNNVTGIVDVNYNQRSDLHIQFITVHKSKGLQADYVFILNNKNSIVGFPSKIQDAELVTMLLENNDHYLYGEERRLFYVAMTRAKKKVFLLTIKNRESCFIREIRKMIKPIQKDVKKKKVEIKCPKCGAKLIKRKGKYGYFYGCSNYPNCKYVQNIKKENSL